MVFGLSSMTGILDELAFIGCANDRRISSSLEVLAGHCASGFSVRWVCWAEMVLSIRACELVFGLGLVFIFNTYNRHDWKQKAKDGVGLRCSEGVRDIYGRGMGECLCSGRLHNSEKRELSALLLQHLELCNWPRNDNRRQTERI